mgnify:CR=1 FL=1
MPASGREWAKSPEGGKHEQDRMLQDAAVSDPPSSRVYAPSPLGGPHELERLKEQETAQLLSVAETLDKVAPAPKEESAPAEDTADVEAEVRESITKKGK